MSINRISRAMIASFHLSTACPHFSISLEVQTLQSLPSIAFAKLLQLRSFFSSLIRVAIAILCSVSVRARMAAVEVAFAFGRALFITMLFTIVVHAALFDPYLPPNCTIAVLFQLFILFGRIMPLVGIQS
jgi:hypothetical protein